MMSNSNSSFSFFESKMGGIPKNNFKMESDPSRLGHNFVLPPTLFDQTDVNNISNLIASQNQDTGNLFDYYEYLASNSTAAAAIITTPSGDIFRASDHSYQILNQINGLIYGDIPQEAKIEALRTADVGPVEDDGFSSIFGSNGINLSGSFISTQVNAILSGESASNHNRSDCSQTFPDQLANLASIQGPGFVLSRTDQDIHGPFENLNSSTLNKYGPSSHFLDINGDHYKVVSELEQSKHKKQKYSEKKDPFINFQQPSGSMSDGEQDAEAIAQMKEMVYREAAFRPVNFDVEVVEKPKRKNVRTSNDPQTVAARQRREKISERIRVLQKLVPGGSQMDTATMLDEAANYLKFLRSFVKELEHLEGAKKRDGKWGY